MSGLFGGGGSQSAIPQRYNGIQVASSSSGGCIPLLSGRVRTSFNCIWYGAFTSTPTQSQGGKGGGGSQTTGYSYTSSYAAAICEGPIASIQNVWRDKDVTTLAAQGLTLFLGSSGQATWSYLTANFASQAIPYDHLCYVGAQNYALGNSAQMPNLNFEVVSTNSLAGTAITFTAAPATGATSATLTSAALANGTWSITFSDYEVRTCTVSGTAVTWSGGLNNQNITTGPITTAALAGPALDADPSAWALEYLTDPNHGATFPTSQVGTLTGSNSFQSYCLALGLTVSPLETTQRAAADYITELLQITNSEAQWSGLGVLNFIPYADSAVSGNGYTYTPNTTPQFSFGEGDFLEPPTLSRKTTADTYNHVRVEFCDRSNDYNTTIAEASDVGNIATTGSERVMSTLSFHQITNSATAGMVAQLILQANLYEMNTIRVKVKSDYMQLDVMDYVAITDPVQADGSGLGYSNQLCRVMKITDAADEADSAHVMELELMEISGVSRTASVYNWASVQGYNANFAAAPGSVQAPAFMEAYGTLVSSSGGRELWIAVDGPSGSGSWGGCQVWLSFDGTTYDQIGTITGGCRYGTISSSISAVADPDTTSTLGVALNNTASVMGSGTQTDADQNRMMIAVGSGSTLEIMSYETATLVSAGNYNLTYLRRGQYATQSQAHSSGAQFIRLDGNIFKIDFDPGYLGTTLYFKFLSFNQYSRAVQALSAATAYTYTPGQSVSAYNATSNATFLAGGYAVMLSPTSAFKQTNAGNAWDSSIYSTQAFSNGCSASCYASQTATGSQVMLGLTTNPTASNSYTNLNYGLYARAGYLEIWESGSQIVGNNAFGTYNTSTLLNVTYDGKHVSYYANGVLLRSVPVVGLTLYMQICFSTAGNGVYGIDYTQITPVVTSFTLQPLTNYVAASGTKAAPNGVVTSPTSGWGNRVFSSKESYNNGCVVSASMNPVGGTAAFGLSTNPSAAVGVTTLSYLGAGWYIDPSTSQCEIWYYGSSVLSGLATPTTSDVFTVEYDTYCFYWYRNQTLVYKQVDPNPGPLYLLGDFYYNLPGSVALTNISFFNSGALSPNPWIATGGCVTHDSTAQKIGPTNGAWDSSVYSLNQYNQCHVQCKPGVASTAGQFMLGLSVNPTLSPSYTNLAYAIFMSGTGYGPYESGVNQSWTVSPPAPSATDLLAITYDNVNVYYYINGILLRTVAIANAQFYAELSFLSTGASVTMLSFGPGTELDSVGTAGIDVNGATVLGQVTGGSAGSLINTSITNTVTIGTLTVGPFPVATSLVLTVAGQLQLTGSTAFSGGCVYGVSTTQYNMSSPLFSAQASINGASGVNGYVPMSQEFSTTLAANTTVTYYYEVYANPTYSGSPAPYTISVANALFKIEAIKR